MPNPDYRIRMPADLTKLTENALWEVLEPLSVGEGVTPAEEMGRFMGFTPGQMALFAVIVTQRAVDEGGLEGYFNGRAGMYWQFAVEGYRRIGDRERADALRQAGVVFPSGRVPANLELRERAVAAADRTQRALTWAPLEDVLFGGHEVRPELLVFLAQHPTDFFLD